MTVVRDGTHIRCVICKLDYFDIALCCGVVIGVKGLMSSGEKMQPCGTPALIIMGSESTLKPLQKKQSLQIYL